MAEKTDKKEMVIFREMAMSSSVMLDALTRLLLAKGVFSEGELSETLREVQDEFDGEKKQ
jgi:hypothetical protein